MDPRSLYNIGTVTCMGRFKCICLGIYLMWGLQPVGQNVYALEHLHLKPQYFDYVSISLFSF